MSVWDNERKPRKQTRFSMIIGKFVSMAKKAQHIDIEIDKLTNSIENAFSGDSFDTELMPISKKDLIPVKKGNGWQFDWKYEFEQPDRRVYKLTIKGNPKITTN